MRVCERLCFLKKKCTDEDLNTHGERISGLFCDVKGETGFMAALISTCILIVRIRRYSMSVSRIC